MGIIGTRIPGWARELQLLPGPVRGDLDRWLLPKPRLPGHLMLTRKQVRRCPWGR